MRKLFSTLLLSLLVIVGLTGCATHEAPKGAPADKPKIKIVTTIFPLYDWTKAILGSDSSHVELTLLLDKGVDLHNYQPTAEDMLKIAEADMFIYVGGESDGWTKDALRTAANKNRIDLNLMEVLGSKAKREETVEGMEPHHHHHHHDHDAHHEPKKHDEHDHDHHEHEHEHEEQAHQGDHEGHDHDKHHHGEHHHHEQAKANASPAHHHDHHAHSAAAHRDEHHDHAHDEAEYDEHIWLSLKNAAHFCDAIENALARIDASHAAAYHKNAAAYKEQLAALDKMYQQALSAAPFKTLLFADRFPFRYLTEDYGLRYHAAFSGCSAETEASFETIAFLSGKLDELNLPAVLTIEGRTHQIAETVVKNSRTPDKKILTLNSMQSITAADVAAGASYLAIMQQNLAVIKQAVQ